MIANVERFLQLPILAHVAAGIQDSAKGVLQAFFVLRLPANFHVCEETEKCAAPICPAPGMRVIESLVAGLRQALGHVANQFEPHARSVELTGLYARDRLDIGSDSFFNPMMLVGHGWKSQVHHFVSQHPIRGEVVLGGFVSHGDSN